MHFASTHLDGLRMITKAPCIILRFDADVKEKSDLSDVFTLLLGGVYFSGFT